MNRGINYLLALLLASNILYAQKLYWIDGTLGKIQSSNLDGSVLSDLVTGTGPAFAIEADLTNSKLYWTDIVNQVIKSSNTAGGGASTLVSKVAGSIMIPRGLALNITGNKIYWSDNGTKKIMSSALDGTGVQSIVTGLSAPGYIAFDQLNNKLYFADNGRSVKTIFRCGSDGTNLETVATGLSQIKGIALNIMEGTIYWIDNGIKKIQKGDLSSLPVTKTDVVTSLSGKLRGLVIDGENNLMYWSDISGGNIMRSTTGGANITTLVSSIAFPLDIALNWTSALPVELISFNASSEDGHVNLKWKTAVEVNNYGFELERMHEGMTGRSGDWVKIGFVKGHGSSNSPQEYSFSDNDVPSGGLQYRLKQIDNDGQVKYYDAVAVSVNSPKEYKLMQNSPNPFNPSTAIKFQLPENTFVVIKVYDMLGCEVATLLNEEKTAGSHIIFWNGKDSHSHTVSSGVYLYTLSAGGYTETRKMNFTK